jgi:hypothetical protein
LHWFSGRLILIGKLIFCEVFLRVFSGLLHSLVVARAHGVLLAGALSLKTPVYSDLLSVQPILITCAGLVIRKVDDVCAVGCFRLFCEFDRLIHFILYPVSLLIPNIKHLTRNLSRNSGICFCFKVEITLLVDYLLHYTLDFATLGVLGNGLGRGVINLHK